MHFLHSEKKYKKFSDTTGRDDGFSLIEVIISMVIFLIVTTAIYGLLQVARVDRNRSSRRADILKNARVAVHLNRKRRSKRRIRLSPARRDLS